MFAELARCHVAKGGRVVSLAHRRELVAQMADALRQEGLTVGVDSRDCPDVQVQVLTVQSALARGECPEGTLLGLDEAHHFAANEYAKLPELFQNQWIVGLTATPERSDGRGLGGIFDCLVVAETIAGLTAAGYLAPCRTLAPTRSVGPGTLALSPVDAWERYAAGRSAVVYCESVEAAHRHAQAFRDRGVDSEAVSGDMAASLRDGVLASFASGTIRVLCNVHVLTEGWDAPRAKCALLARPIGSAGLYLQIAGRILRPWQDTPALLIDLTGASSEAYGDVGDDLDYSLGGVGIVRRGIVIEGGVCERHGAPKPCLLCGVDVARPMRVANVPLTDRQAANRGRDDDDRRAKYLAWLVREQRSKRYRIGWVRARYKGRYGVWPSEGQIARAANG